VIGGGGARYIVDEVDRGAIAAMPAAEITDVHVALFEAYRAGNIPLARDLYRRTLPLLVIQALWRMRSPSMCSAGAACSPMMSSARRFLRLTPMTSRKSMPCSARSRPAHGRAARAGRRMIACFKRMAQSHDERPEDEMDGSTPQIPTEEQSRLKMLALGGVAALALGCFSTLPAMAQTKVLKFVSWQKDERGVGDWWANIIKAFEAKNPGVKVEWTKVERGAYADTMTTLFAGGKPPDIVHLASFELQKFADQGWLEDLGPYIKSSGLDLKDWAGQEACVWKGKTVCTMMLYFGNIFAYNEDAFRKRGSRYRRIMPNTSLRPGSSPRTPTAMVLPISSAPAMKPRAGAGNTSPNS